jgi:hypothetical protein
MNIYCTLVGVIKEVFEEAVYFVKKVSFARGECIEFFCFTTAPPLPLPSGP